ncbi:MAG: Asp-tRNA(Asn)/Glu-tRNA(Gln) amidotransferase GatCAB subunit A [Gemmatimonadetes bacterium]|nr:MAG: Asp-tRNA(Asn)/Glu-tRNA(Gln) amidotransferase GatCAB subunit A [Gemmatimonadota bacterium]PYP31391.1 MAG: Asp-tRNA(Asn)/Glu-tRNA(Gln) amidotransferase GatCAB subunit A [Gemmatimonadota bacterium]
MDPTEALASAKAAADRLVKAKRLNACLTPPKDLRKSLLQQAQAAHPSGVLYGMPVAVKDNICTLEFTTTCGSKVLKAYRSPFEATAVAKLRAAGALIAGKTNCDEFGMGSSTEHSAYGRTLHPTDKVRVPGGSSGGSAALVAAGAVPAALGSETGGSVRQPASFCGVVGIKPTYGRVSRYGLVAFGSSLDQIGVLGRSVHDAARVLSVISGRDPKDSTCEDRDPLRLPTVPESLQGFVIGIPKEYFPPDLDAGVRRACDRAIRLLKELGAAVRDVSLPHTSYAVPTYYIIAPAEASSNLARYDGARYGPRFDGQLDVRSLYRRTRGEGFGPEVRRRILVGTYVLSSGYYDAYYRKAQQMRALIAQDFRNVFDRGVDLLFTPTTPSSAFKAGEKLADPVAMYLSDIFTVTANLAGVPALSLPVGRIKGLPIGGQFIGQAFLEDEMLEAAYALERVVPAGEDV